MLLRQSRTTHPLVSPVMCVTACVGKYHVLFNYKCILSTVVDVRGMVRLPVLFEVYVLIQLFPPQKHGTLMQPVRLCTFSYLRTPSHHSKLVAQVFSFFFFKLLEVVHIKY